MGHILAFMMILWLGISHVSAEYILLEKDKLGEYKSVKHSNPNALKALKITQRYSWPTISLFFDTFEHDEKEKYLDSLKYEHGVTRFINHQLKTKIAKNYVVYFVPDALFELAALSRIPLLNEFNEEDWGVPANSLNRWEIMPSWIASMFNKAIEEKESRILQSVFQENIYPPKSRENKFNKSFEMHFQAGEDLWEQIREGLKEKLVFNSDENHFINVLSDDISGEIIKHFLQETKNNYIKIIKDKYPDKDDKFVKEHAGGGLRSQGLLFPISDSIDTPTDKMEKFILKSLRFSFEAERRNTFLLFRGGGGREVTVTGHTPSTYQKEPHRIEESGDIHSLPLAVELKVDHIQSLSFGNSLLAGSVFENARQTLQSGARVLDYAITTSIFYGIEIPLVAYLTGVVKNKDGNPNLSHPKNLIYIAPLATIPALFAAGELFHSRTKFSRYLSNGTQKSLDTVDAIDGLRIKDGLSNILRNDEEEKLGLFCFPRDITWDKDMVPHLARFIADHLVVFDTSLKRNGKLIAPKEIESAQKGMLSMEYQRLADLAQEQHKPEEMQSVRDKLKKPLK